MAHAATIAGAVFMGTVLMGPVSALAQEDPPAYAVVSEVPKDKTRVSAKIVIDGTVSDTKLLASEAIVGNLIWKKLEICHAMRLEGQRSGEGFRVTTVRAVDASMLPMALQGFAGDCLLKKALEIAPLVD
ncbi:MAG: hypothetical protein IT389_16025 [Nitrospira sp.]|nr:hypothetical protein [Nitrospira sp.]